MRPPARRRRTWGFSAAPMREKRFGGIVADWEDYLRLFANAGDEVAVEGQRLLLVADSAGTNRRQDSDAKILVMLRDPAEQAFSDTSTASRE